MRALEAHAVFLTEVLGELLTLGFHIALKESRARSEATATHEDVGVSLRW